MEVSTLTFPQGLMLHFIVSYWSSIGSVLCSSWRGWVSSNLFFVLDPGAFIPYQMSMYPKGLWDWVQSTLPCGQKPGNSQETMKCISMFSVHPLPCFLVTQHPFKKILLGLYGLFRKWMTLLNIGGNIFFQQKPCWTKTGAAQEASFVFLFLCTSAQVHVRIDQELLTVWEGEKRLVECWPTASKRHVLCCLHPLYYPCFLMFGMQSRDWNKKSTDSQAGSSLSVELSPQS